MRREYVRSLCSVAAGLVLVATGITQPQSAPGSQTAPTEASQTSAATVAQQAQPAASLRVTTRLVLVDVVALDHKGLPVTDLKGEEFTLREEGAEQKVRVFSFQQPNAAEGAA